MKKWDKVADEDVRMVWKYKCKCDNGNKEVIVNPTFYEDAGVPICPSCGKDCKYSRTEMVSVDNYL